MFFLSPADVKDTGFLTYDYDDRTRTTISGSIFRRSRRPSESRPGDKSGSFMGSDFTYADMSDRGFSTATSTSSSRRTR